MCAGNAWKKWVTLRTVQKKSPRWPVVQERSGGYKTYEGVWFFFFPGRGVASPFVTNLTINKGYLSRTEPALFGKSRKLFFVPSRTPTTTRTPCPNQM